MGAAGRGRQRPPARSADERGARGAEAAPQGELRAAPGERDLEGRVRLFRDRSSTRPGDGDPLRGGAAGCLRGRADLRGDGRAGEHALRAQIPEAVRRELADRELLRRDRGGPRGRRRVYGARKTWKELQPPRRRGRPRPGRPCDAPARARGQAPRRQEAHDDPGRGRGRAGPRPLAARLHARPARTRSGSPTSPTSAPGTASSTSPSSSTATAG